MPNEAPIAPARAAMAVEAPPLGARSALSVSVAMSVLSPNANRALASSASGSKGYVKIGADFLATLLVELLALGGQQDDVDLRSHREYGETNAPEIRWHDRR